MTIKEYHSKYFNQIQKNKQKQQEKIIKIALKSVSEAIKNKKFDWTEVENQLINEVYNSLADTLSSSLSLAKEAYGIKDKKLNLKELTWQDDKKTIEDRIKLYCQTISQIIELEEEANEIKLKSALVYSLTRLLNTETMVIHNRSIWQLIKDKAIYVEIWNEDDQCDGDCGCEAYYNQGKFLVKDLKDLPPYHPDCECYPVYYLEREKGENDESKDE